MRTARTPVVALRYLIHPPHLPRCGHLPRAAPAAPRRRLSDRRAERWTRRMGSADTHLSRKHEKPLFGGVRGPIRARAGAMLASACVWTRTERRFVLPYSPRTTRPGEANVPTTVMIPTPLRTYAGGAKRVGVAGATVGDALTDLSGRHPQLRQHLYAETGELRGFVNVYLN